MRIKALLFFVLPVLFSCASEDFDKDRLDAYFDALADVYQGSVAVTKNGKNIYCNSTGKKYLTGSISKTFTAVLVYQAEADGLLSTSDTLSKYFPQIKGSADITLDNMLCHRSGIYDVFEDKDYWEWYTLPQSREELLSRMSCAQPLFPAGTQSSYCNGNYVLLSFILEDVYGKKFGELVKEKIAEPLGLNDTYIWTGADEAKKECRSYKYTGDWELLPETDPSVPYGAGAIMSTPEDLCVFANALFSGKFGDDILSKITDVAGDYGHGVFHYSFGPYEGIGHLGGIDGFTSAMFYFPDGMVVSLCSNASGINQNDVLLTVLQCLHGQEFEIPDYDFATMTEKELSDYCGVYSSAELGMDIEVSSNGRVLLAQPSGQNALVLNLQKDGVFVNLPGGLLFRIEPSSNKLTLIQNSQEYLFVRG